MRQFLGLLCECCCKLLALCESAWTCDQPGEHFPGAASEACPESLGDAAATMGVEALESELAQDALYCAPQLRQPEILSLAFFNLHDVMTSKLVHA